MNDSILILAVSGIIIAYLLYKILCLSEREKGRREVLHHIPSSMPIPISSHQNYRPPINQKLSKSNRNRRKNSYTGLTFFFGLILLVGMLIMLFNDTSAKKNTPTSNRNNGLVKSALLMNSVFEKTEPLWDNKLINEPSPNNFKSEFFIQTGSFRERENASKQVDFLLQKRFDADYIQISDNEGMFKVLFGPFPNKDWAEEKQKEFDKLFSKTIVKKQRKH